MQRYKQSKNEAFYDMITQKISQKIDSLPEIPCLSERWIWQLIQNAKDADSVFNQIKIKIEIFDTKFVFSHNGNPFILENINSLIFHYSAKDEENKKEVETTGKYGTGFMVTYAISKKVLLQCKYKGVPQIKYEYENDEDEDQLNKILNNQDHKPSEKIKAPEKKNLITNKQKNKINKVEEKAKVEEPYYQDLNIILDRNYTNIKELKEKIIKVDRSVEKQLNTSPKDVNYIRTEKSFDTCFIYAELDETSFSHIEKGMQSLKLLFPLVLLFNKKLFSIEVMNYSAKLKNLRSFKIVSQGSNKYDMFDIFTAAIYEMKNKEKLSKVYNKDQQDNIAIKESRITQQYLYSQSQAINGIMAFPVQIVDKNIHLLRFSENFPKIFKEFPLIGCDDLGFNFAFTSKQLYPSENRRQLLLKQTPGRRCLKAEQNHKILSNLFSEAKDNYILLSKLINKGKFHFFVLPKTNNFLFEYPQIKAKMEKISEKVHTFQMFTNLKKQKKSIKSVQIFIEDHLSLSISRLAYNTFNFLFPEALSCQDYDQLINEIPKNKYQLKNMLYSIQAKFIGVRDCTLKMQKLGYEKVSKFFSTQTEELTFNCLEKIYKFLIQHNPLLFFSNQKIILNQQLTFCCFYQNQDTRLQLQVDFCDKKQYFEIAKKLNISIQKSLIHTRFTDTFMPSFEKAVNFINDKNQKKMCPVNYTEEILKQISNMRFENTSILNKILQHFKQRKYKEKQMILNTQDLISLGKYLNSFQNINLPQLSYAQYFSRFQATILHLSTIKIKTKNQKIMKVNNQLTEMFKQAFSKEILLIYEQSRSINVFVQSLCDKSKAKAFQIINYLYRTDKILVNCLPNADEEIAAKNDYLYTTNKLKWLNQGYNYLTDDDITIFDKLYNKCNDLLSTQLKPINKMLVHRSIIKCQNSIALFGGITIQFSQLFKPIKNLYNLNNIKLQDKEAILNYTYNIYEEFIIKNNKAFEIKYNLFKDIISSRHLEFGKLLDKLNDEDKDLICKIFKMKDKFQDLRELINNYSIQEILAVMRKRNRQK